MKILKISFCFCTITLSIIFIFGSCAKNYPPAPSPSDTFSKYATILNDSIGLPSSKQFREYFNPLLLKWEKNVPEDVQKRLSDFVDIKNFLLANNYDYDNIKMYKSARKIEKMGSYAYGASYRLSLVLGDNALIMPGNTSLGHQARDALISIGEWSIIALIISLDIEKYKNETNAYSSEVAKTWANVALNEITGQNFRFYQNIWIAWFMDKYSGSNFLSKITK